MYTSAVQDAFFQRNGHFKQTEEIYSLVANALLYVVQNVFANQTNTLIFTISTTGAAADIWFNEVIKKLFPFLGFIAIQLLVLESKSKTLEPLNHPSCHMIMTDSYKSLEKTNITRYNQNSDGLEYYFILLQAYSGVIVNREMELIFRYCYNNYWINCNVMVNSDQGDIFVYSYFPYKENNCYQTQPEMINQYSNKQFRNRVIFPDKLSNLHKCGLKISTWNIPPFVKNGTKKRYPGYTVTGFEMIALIEVSRKMNFSMDIEWITLNKNQSPESTLLEKLINRETNITLGMFRRTSARDKIATPTSVTYFVPIIPLVLRKKAIHISMSILTFPFDYCTWILMIVIYTALAIINAIQTKDFKKGIFQTFQIAFGSSVKNIPKRNSTRVRVITTIISFFILRSVYQSLLFYIFRTNFYQMPPYSLNGFGAEGYKAVATEVTAQFLLQIPEIANKTLPLIVTNSSSEMSPMRYMEFHRNESLVSMSTLEFTIRYAREEMSFKTVLGAIPLRVTDQQIGFYLTKHSFLIDSLNNYIQRLHACGLLKMWKKWDEADYKIIRRTISTRQYNSAVMITLNQFTEFLLLLGILHLISIVLFVFEILSIKYKWLRKFL